MAQLAIVVIPILFAAGLIDAFCFRHRRPDASTRADVHVNVVLGIMSFSTGVLMHGFFLQYFTFIMQFAPFRPGWNWWSFLVCLLLCDLTGYLFHLLGHKSRLLWAAHAAHHSSEHFNLSTGLRIPFHSTHRLLFWTPVALLGFPAWMILSTESLIALYTFSVHSDRIGKLGWLEKVMVTPSHHRVHHGRNPEYIDKNFGAVFIIWDRMFGTFAVEVAPPEYGATHPIHTNNPLKVAFGEYGRVALGAWHQMSPLRALRYLLKPPGSDD